MVEPFFWLSHTRSVLDVNKGYRIVAVWAPETSCNCGKVESLPLTFLPQIGRQEDAKVTGSSRPTED